MSRPKGSKNKKVRSDKGKTRKSSSKELIISPVDNKLHVIEEDESLDIFSTITRCSCTLCGNEPPKKPSIIYNIHKTKKQGVEKRIRTLVKKARSFWLETNVLGDDIKYFVDGGGWVTEVGTKGTVSHIKNLLPFFDGPHPIWGEVKRSYVKRQVNRGLHVK